MTKKDIILKLKADKKALLCFIPKVDIRGELHHYQLHAQLDYINLLLEWIQQERKL